ncbi:MAG: DUF4383 domain-containing protein [Actinomycetota bacterium]
MLVSAVWHLPLGIIGFVYNRTFPIGADATANAPSGLVFGMFETNGWHTLGALAVGLFSLYFALRSQNARQAALALGVTHVGLVLALILRDPSTFWIASNAADQVVHASTAVGGIASGLLTTPGIRAAGTAHVTFEEIARER